MTLFRFFEGEDVAYRVSNSTRTDMRILLTYLIVLASIVVAVVSPVSAQGFNGGGFNVGLGPFASGGGGYTGPADAISANLLGCWSLRACSAATRGTKVANVCVTGTCADMLSDATTGDLVSQTINGTVCPSAGTTCLVKTLYFQAGSETCTSSCDLTNAALNATNPILTTSCGASLKTFCMSLTFANGSTLASGTFNTAIPQPFTYVAVGLQNNTLQSGNSGIMSIGASGATAEMGWGGNTTNTAIIYAGSATVTGPQAVNSWHSIQGIFQTTTSFITVDGTSGTSVSPGSNGITTSGALKFGTSGFGEFMNGFLVELLIYSTNFTSGNATTMCHNQYSYWISASPPC